MTQPTNLYNYLLANYENIDSIPDLAARLDAIESQMGNLDEGDLSDEFDPGDHDELFADGGATERSFNAADHAEVFESPNI